MYTLEITITLRSYFVNRFFSILKYAAENTSICR